MAITDMQGRLQGKRLDAGAFVREIAEHGAEGCHYLLAVDIDMNTLPGFRCRAGTPATATSCSAPTSPRCAAARGSRAPRWCRPTWSGTTASPVEQAPRSILKAQLARLAERGWTAKIGLGAGVHPVPRDVRGEPREGLPRPGARQRVQRRLLHLRHHDRRGRDPPDPPAHGAMPGLVVEDSKGECNFGQHEVNFRYADALKMADDHAVYKNGAKEIAWQHGAALSFIAKFNEREGNSCHIHCSFWDGDEQPVPRPDGHGRSPLFESFIAGQLAVHDRARLLLRAERQLVQALRARLVRADRDGLGRGQPHLRVPRRRPRQGHAARVALPGGDCNPYLAFAAIIARASRASTAAWSSSRRSTGNAYDVRRPRVPGSLHEAIRLLEESAFARQRVRRRRSSTTTSTPPGSSSRPSRAPSPTGSCTAPSSGCRPVRPRIGISAYWRAASWGPWPTCRRHVHAGLRRGRAGGGRPALLIPPDPPTRRRRRPACSRCSTG